MCIRDRYKDALQPADFYHNFKQLGIRSVQLIPHLEFDDRGDLTAASVTAEPVSYTHLDVYKRQLLGRLVCGFLCPFGWIQELLHKIPGRKLKVRPSIDRPLRFFKYGVLVLFVLALPAFAVDAFGLGAPWFCKWICPAGTLEGGIPLVLTNASLRAGLGFTFWWKMSLLLLTLAFSVLIYRPFCKYVCPLGAFYALFNRWSLVRMQLDRSQCISCGACERACPMQVPVLKLSLIHI